VVLAVVFTVYFLLLTVFEILSSMNFWIGGGSPMNVFVLGTVTATCLKGLVTKKDSYLVAATLIASSFSLLMILTYLATGDFSFGVLGVVVSPYAIKKLK